jgi:hypothetical protein
MPDDFTHDVFLSHSSKDKAVVRAVAERMVGSVRCADRRRVQRRNTFWAEPAQIVPALHGPEDIAARCPYRFRSSRSGCGRTGCACGSMSGKCNSCGLCVFAPLR